MEIMGAPQDLIDKEDEEPKQTLGFPVFQENTKYIEWLLVMQNQWKYAGMAGTRVGFDYSIMPFFSEVFNLKIDDELLSGLMEMEMHILSVFNSQA